MSQFTIAKNRNNNEYNVDGFTYIDNWIQLSPGIILNFFVKILYIIGKVRNNDAKNNLHIWWNIFKGII